MGAIYGNCATTALEDAPQEARGILSGMLQQGYAFGYLLAVVFARAFVNPTTHVWRPLFWFGACPPVLIIIGRLMLPETDSLLARQAMKREQRAGVESIERVLWKEGKVGLKKHWLILVYLVLMMAGFSYMVNPFSSPAFEFPFYFLHSANKSPKCSLTARKISTQQCSKTSWISPPTKLPSLKQSPTSALYLAVPSPATRHK